MSADNTVDQGASKQIRAGLAELYAKYNLISYPEPSWENFRRYPDAFRQEPLPLPKDVLAPALEIFEILDKHLGNKPFAHFAKGEALRIAMVLVGVKPGA
jgi:hypothetical protein